MYKLADKVVTGDKRVLTVRDVTDIFRDTVNIHIPTQGVVHDESNFSCRYKAIDCDIQEASNILRIFNIRGENVTSNTIASNDAVLSTSRSLNGKFTAVLKKSNSTDIEQVLEIWSHLSADSTNLSNVDTKSRLLKTIVISKIEPHGSINTDPVFSSLVWCPFGDQDKLLYICQPKKIKHSNFFQNNFTSGQSEESEKLECSIESAKPVVLGGEFLRKEDWGECLTGIEHTLIGILDVADGFKIKTIDLRDHSLASARWIVGTNGPMIVSVAYLENPRRLGVIYCNNRKSKIVIHDISSQDEPILELQDDSESYNRVQVSNAGDKIIYIANRTFGPHRHSDKLMIYDIKLAQQRVLQDEIFIQNLPENCFSSDDRYILVEQFDHLNNYLYLYCTTERDVTIQGKFVRLEFPTAVVGLLDFRYNTILATGCEINSSPALFVGKLEGTKVTWNKLSGSNTFDELEYSTHVIPTLDKSTFISTIFVKPRLDQDNDLPTVVIVHGGPHSCFVQSYMPVLLFYARLGLKSLLINYRGSSGVSEDYLMSLNGKIGQLDVEDCMHAIRHFVQERKINRKKLIIQGGSHGGFLSCHLSCQDEFKFTSAIIRNPVVDMNSMYSTTDIPDWILNEVLGQQHFDFTSNPNADDHFKIFQASPIAKVSKANVPTLMLLGSKDQRVPYESGLRWVDLLKARGVETACKVYPDKHDLGKVDVYIDSTMTAAVWILNHLPE